MNNKPLKDARLGSLVDRESKMSLKQIGWVGQTGAVYSLDNQPTVQQEPASYQPLFISIGIWEKRKNELTGKFEWRVEED